MAGNKRSAKGFPGAKEVGPELLFEKCDILILAAMEKALTGDNASKIKAKVSNGLCDSSISTNPQRMDELLIK